MSVGEGGTYTFIARVKEVIRRRGENLSPLEVEDVLTAHPAVLECAVVGIVDTLQLVRPEAFVVLQPGRNGGAAMVSELREHVRSILAHFKCPRAFTFVADLPKTATGKIQRFRLRQLPQGPAAASGTGR